MNNPKRRIKSADVKLLSLCRRPANRLQALYKSEDGSAELQALVKYQAEQGELLALGYLPNTSDAVGDTADRASVKSMAYSLMKNGAGLDIQHRAVDANMNIISANVLRKDQAYVAESFIVQAGDPRFVGWKDLSGNAIDATDGWGVLVKIDDPILREEYKSGRLDGVSLFAPAAEVEPIQKSDEATTRIVEATIKALQGSKETDVDIKEFTTALAANNEALIAGLTKALKPEPPATPPAPKVEDKKDEAPILKAEDRTDPEKIKAHLQAVKLYNLQKTVDWADPKAVENYQAQLETLTKTEKVEETDEVKGLRAEIAERDQRIASIKKASGQSTTEVARPTGQADLLKSAGSVADWANKQRGFATK